MESAPQPRHSHSVWETVAIGCLVAFVLIVAENLFAHTEMGKLFEQSTYVWLHHRLKVQPQNLPVTVIDISGVEAEAVTNGVSQERHKPRPVLTKLVEAVAAQHPKAIGIDLEFSPREDFTLQTADDPAFFNACLRIREELGVPVYLAVVRSTTAVNPAGWLGLPQFERLASNAMVTHSAESLPLWTQAQAAPQEAPPPKLLSMSSSLAREYREDSTPEVAHWLEPWVEAVRVDTESAYSYGDYRVDYSALDELKTGAIRVSKPEELAAHAEALSGKLVLMGNGNFEDLPSDSFAVPGREAPVPGVYVHASGVYTLLNGPLYELTKKGRLALDLTFSFLAIAGVAICSARFKHVGARRFQLLITLCASLLVFFAGGLLVTSVRLIWEDFIIVALALWVHPLVEDEMVEFGSWIWRSVRGPEPAHASPSPHHKRRKK